MGRVSGFDGKRVYADANVFIYAFDSVAPWNVVCQAVLDLGIAQRSTIVTSSYSLIECLVKPFRNGDSSTANLYLAAIQSRLGLTVVEATRDLIIEAARIRAAYPACRAPDAIHLAAAKSLACDVFLTNDVRLKNVNVGPEVVLLSDLTV